LNAEADLIEHVRPYRPVGAYVGTGEGVPRNSISSGDGGRTFGPSGGRMFGDHHALSIDPTRPTRLLCGTDGGFFTSNDHGRNWDFVNNIPLAQAYHVGVDTADPYNVLGGFQDHEIWREPNERWNEVGVREGDWKRLPWPMDRTRSPVGGYTGRPTPAQRDWIARFSADRDRLARGLQNVAGDSLAQLNGRLRMAGLPEVVPAGAPPRR
jgi:hypothetical protein